MLLLSFIVVLTAAIETYFKNVCNFDILSCSVCRSNLFCYKTEVCYDQLFFKIGILYIRIAHLTSYQIPGQAFLSGHSGGLGS